MKCKYWDCGFCYAPEGVEHNSKNGSCNEPLFCPYFNENKTQMLDEQGHLECEIKELQLEMKQNSETITNLCGILEQNTEKLRKLKEMNHRTPYKPQVEYCDEQMVIVNGVQYQRVEPPKPPTLYDALCEKGGMYSSVCDTVVEIVKEWLPLERYENGDGYNIGWNDCLQHLKENIK